MSIETQLKTYTGPLKFEFLPESVEKVFTSEMPWESRALNYFNIMHNDSNWNMWYNAYAIDQADFNGSFCLAKSSDGTSWSRPFINNNTNILLSGDNQTGVGETFVFKDDDDKSSPFKMICSKLVDGKQRTFLYSSADGISWRSNKELYNMMQDSQFGVIDRNGFYYIFSRYNDFSQGYQRAIGLSILDKGLNTVQSPMLLLKADVNSSFPHIYNNAASYINDSTMLLIPTYFNETSNSIRIKLIYTNNLHDYYLVDDDITRDLFPSNNANWAIVSPGVIPAQEKDTYWVYYFGTDSKHSQFNLLPKINVTYYRIKLVIHE